MHDASPTDSVTVVRALLHGGPTDIPDDLRVQQVAADQAKIKLPWRGGYEHFERDPLAVESTTDTVVFRWTTRTRIAE